MPTLSRCSAGSHVTSAPAWKTYETGSGELEESIIRTARGLYVGDLINEKEYIYSRLYTHTVYSRVLECLSIYMCAHAGLYEVLA